MKKIILAVLLPILLTALMPEVAMAQGNSDETLMRNSVKHYTQALIAYNDGDLSAVSGLLQAAASNAKHIDPELSGLLEELRSGFMSTGNLYEEVARRIGIIYNDYYGEQLFDPNHPTGKPWKRSWDPGDYSPS